MKVLVDTSIWSLALRRERPADDGRVRELVELMERHNIKRIPIVRDAADAGDRLIVGRRLYFASHPAIHFGSSSSANAGSQLLWLASG